MAQSPDTAQLYGLSPCGRHPAAVTFQPSGKTARNIVSVPVVTKACWPYRSTRRAGDGAGRSSCRSATGQAVPADSATADCTSGDSRPHASDPSAAKTACAKAAAVCSGPVVSGPEQPDTATAAATANAAAATTEPPLDLTFWTLLVHRALRASSRRGQATAGR